MPFREVDEKLEFAMLASAEDADMRRLCRRFGEGPRWPAPRLRVSRISDSGYWPPPSFVLVAEYASHALFGRMVFVPFIPSRKCWPSYWKQP